MRESLVEAMAALERAVPGLGVPYMVIGGVAVILRGVPRLTDDVDATIWADGLVLESLLVALAKQEIVPRIPDALAFARQNQVLLLRHQPSATDMEMTLAWLPFEREALAAAEQVAVSGLQVPVARAEDLVVYKAIAWRARDRGDIEGLLRLYGDRIDLDRVRKVLGEFAEALGAPERLREFEALVSRARPGSP